MLNAGIWEFCDRGYDCKFLNGNVLILKSGFYSDRLINISKYYKKFKYIKKIDLLDWKEYEKINKNTIGFFSVILKQVWGLSCL